VVPADKLASVADVPQDRVGAGRVVSGSRTAPQRLLSQEPARSRAPGEALGTRGRQRERSISAPVARRARNCVSSAAASTAHDGHRALTREKPRPEFRKRAPSITSPTYRSGRGNTRRSTLEYRGYRQFLSAPAIRRNCTSGGGKTAHQQGPEPDRRRRRSRSRQKIRLRKAASMFLEPTTRTPRTGSAARALREPLDQGRRVVRGRGRNTVKVDSARSSAPHADAPRRPLGARLRPVRPGKHAPRPEHGTNAPRR